MGYDTIIVGAGSAGAIVAARLTEDPDRSVLLLEAGPDYRSVESLPVDVKWGYGDQVTPKARLSSLNIARFVARATGRGRPMIVPRGKVTGGSMRADTSATTIGHRRADRRFREERGVGIAPDE